MENTAIAVTCHSHTVNCDSCDAVIETGTQFTQIWCEGSHVICFCRDCADPWKKCLDSYQNGADASMEDL